MAFESTLENFKWSTLIKKCLVNRAISSRENVIVNKHICLTVSQSIGCQELMLQHETAVL